MRYALGNLGIQSASGKFDVVQSGGGGSVRHSYNGSEGRWCSRFGRELRCEVE